MPRLREVTLDFARGEAPLESLREAARVEKFDIHLADALLQAIADWEASAWPNSHWARNELRDRAKKLVPPAPDPSKRKKTGKEHAANMYATGLRGYWRQD